MKKLTQNLRWLVTLLAMIVSVGMWATEYKLTISTSDFIDGGYAVNNNEKTSTAVCTTDATKTIEVKWTSYQVMKNGENMQWKKNEGYLYNSTNLGTIKSVTVTSSAETFTTYYGTSEHPTSNTTVGNGFFTVKVGNATGTSSKVEVVFEKLDAVATPTFTPTPGNYSEQQTVELACETEGASIYFTTDGTDPSISSSLYSDPFTITTTTTIKAIAVKDGYDNSEVATALYTISIPVSGYTIDFERSLDCYVDWEFTNIGIHNSEITAHGGTYYGANVNSSDNGVGTASIQTKARVANPYTFTCYVSKESTNTTASTWYVEVSSDGTNWTTVESQSASSMSKGSWTEVTTNLSNYSNVYVRLRYSGSTAIRTVDDISIALGGTPKVATPTFSVAEGTYTEAQSVEISCTTEGATIYYTIDGTTPDASSTAYSSAITISSTTTIRAIAVKADYDNSEVAEVTYTITTPQPVSSDQYVLVTSNDQLVAGQEYIIVGKYSNTETYFAMSTNQKTNNREAVGITVSEHIATISSSSNVQVITLEGNSNGWYFYTGSGYLYAASSTDNYLRTKTTADDNAKALIVLSSDGYATIEFQGNNKRNLLRFNSGSDLFSCYASGQQPVQLYKKNLDFDNVVVTQGGQGSDGKYYATYTSKYNLDFSSVDGLEAFIVIAAPYEGEIAVSSVDRVPANTPVLVCSSEAKEYQVRVCGTTDDVSENQLQVATADTKGDGETIFVLAKERLGLGFYRVKAGIPLNVGKAYLQIVKPTNGQPVKSFISIGGDYANAIEAMEMTSEQNKSTIYNLNGQRVIVPVKGGLYMMNGKKLMVK